ncbi:uncharacterized protein LOC127103989 [Lathyrus oleraceus]|uniref:uncharacterized protein LOC127103989 n=1 Tax=Pisum sativum TaxID=3888 RepID=UPI0021CECCFF|nr:uncharacterized protein LOC127103989 [Pisum sativum]
MSDSSSSESCNPNKEDPVSDSANTSHARRPKETVSSFSSGIALNEQTREGSRYVHNAIATMVTGILSGNHKVLGVSIPLNTIVPDNVACQENTVSLGKNVSDDAEQTDAHEGSNIDKPLDNVGGEQVRVTHDVSDNPNCEAEIVDLEEFFDNELLTSVVPSIAKRVRTRREKKTVVQRSPKRKIDVPTSPNPKVAESSLKRKGHGPTKYWSKGVPKKMKTKWKYVYHKRLALERELAQNVLECKEIVDLIQEAGLKKIVTQFSKYYEILVKEFIVYVSKECADGKSKEFRKVYVRANQVRKWPLKDKLVASKLSVKYAMLHKIGVANWVPTNHKSKVFVMLGKFIYVVGTKANFDYGSYIFDQTMKHAGSFSVKGPIAFPSLICGIVLNQFPNILTENDSMKRRDSPLAFNHKLFLGKHVPDIAMATGETSSVCKQPGKADVIAILKETCKELEALKLTLENLIIKLEMTEGDVIGEAVDAAEGAARQSTEGEEDASPDDGTDDDADSESDE